MSHENHCAHMTVAAKENNRQCQQIISEHHRWTCAATHSDHDQPCIFDDVLGLHLRCWGEEDSFSCKKAKIFSSASITSQDCQAHGTVCPFPHVDFDHSGLPCVDNSRARHHRKFEEGGSGPLFIVWALRLRRYGIKLAVLENTPAPWLNLQN